MTSEKRPTELHSTEETARRTFLKQVGKAAATAPAVALLLAASTKPASARQVYGLFVLTGTEVGVEFLGGESGSPVERVDLRRDDVLAQKLAPEVLKHIIELHHQHEEEQHTGVAPHPLSFRQRCCRRDGRRGLCLIAFLICGHRRIHRLLNARSSG